MKDSTQAQGRKTQDSRSRTQDRIPHFAPLFPVSCVLSPPVSPAQPDIPPTPASMLVSVGGSPAPVVATLLKFHPGKVIFFVSAGSRELVSREILPRLTPHPLPDHEFILTPDEQDLGASVQALLEQVPKAMAKLGMDASWPEHVDYTGGTKTMSAAVVWASARQARAFSYVGAATKDGRHKDGLGAVVDGQEMPIFTGNPWHRTCLFEIREAAIAFNQARYAAAAEQVAAIKERLSPQHGLRAPFVHLHGIVAAYAAWDNFRYRDAANLLERHAIPFLAAAAHPEFNLVCDFRAFAEEVARDRDRIRNIPPDQSSWAGIHDLLANARRRAETENKFDDAIVRAYAVIEKTAQHELRKTYGIDPGDCDPALLPDAVHHEYVGRYTTPNHHGGQPVIQFGLVAGYRLLSLLGNPLGTRFETLPNLLRHLQRRNESYLAHGAEPLGSTDWDVLFADALSILNLERNALPAFPTVEIK